MSIAEDPSGSAAASSVSLARVEQLLSRPLLELVFDAAQVHRAHHDSSRVQCSQLLSIKTGGCPEDCGYCSQSAHHKTPVEREPLLEVDEVLKKARAAKENGADRFCMGAAWRSAKSGEEFERVLSMVRGVKEMGLEACATLGMLDSEQAGRLQEAGLDYYNHNLDTGRSHYQDVVHTRSYDERLETLKRVRESGMKVCCGGILGLGEERRGRAELLCELANLNPAPESVPVNTLVQVEGTPFAAPGKAPEQVDWSELVRTVAVARILMPGSAVRLSAGRTEMDEATQAMCFLAGANSMFVGDELLTTPNPAPQSDAALLGKLGLNAIAEVE
ncbi:MAG: biotin synthase BioB [Planctomycetota bacterium]